MAHKELKKILTKRNMSVKDLAKEIGYTRVHTSNVINGHVRSIRAEKLIAFVLGKPRERLFK
jgi:DNA-binding Xre family transcriptional regulator